MDGYVQLMGLGLELRFAMGADIGFGHEYDIPRHRDQGNGNGNIVPRHVHGIAEPVDRTGGEGEGYG